VSERKIEMPVKDGGLSWEKKTQKIMSEVTATKFYKGEKKEEKER